MRITAILRNKGTSVVTIRPDASVRQLLAALARHNVGALIVSEDGRTIEGIVSERDVVRQLDKQGAALMSSPVSSIMTLNVRTCAPDDHVDDLRRTMTDLRIRHLPVLQDGRLAGIVSIGDVVKSAINELEVDRDALADYVQR